MILILEEFIRYIFFYKSKRIDYQKCLLDIIGMNIDLRLLYQDVDFIWEIISWLFLLGDLREMIIDDWLIEDIIFDDWLL